VTAALYGSPPSFDSTDRRFTGLGEYTCKECGRLFPAPTAPPGMRCDGCVHLEAAVMSVRKSTPPPPIVDCFSTSVFTCEVTTVRKEPDESDRT